MKVLVICDDLWHPADVIRRGLEGLDGEKYDFDVVVSAKDILTPEYIRDFDVIINAKSNQINAANPAPWFEPTVTEVGPQEFRSYIEAGGGFLSLHSGNTIQPDTAPDYCALVGNHFITHPLRCPVTVRPTKDHPITRGVQPFTQRDEHYQLALLTQDREDFLETVSAPGGVQVAGYTRTIGKGRLCVLTPGHTLAMWQEPNFIKLLSNAMDWCAGEV